MMIDDGLDMDAVVQIETALKDNCTSGHGFEKVLKPIREICDAHGWDWFTGGSKVEFNRRCMFLYQSYSNSDHSDFRKEQLIEGNFAFWIYKADQECPTDHQGLNGYAIAPNEQFWQLYYPPLNAGCSCYVIGASSDRMVARLGGEIGKELPHMLPQVTSYRGVYNLLAAIKSRDIPTAENG